MKVAIIHGTKRQGNESIKAARLILKIGQELEEIEPTLIEPKDYPEIRNDGSGTKEDTKYNELIRKADAYIIVTPEYNHSYPGALKTLLDSAYKEYVHKPVVIAGVSGGPWGGTRVVGSLVPVLRQFGMLVSFADLYFPKVKELFDENGNLKDESYIDKIKTSYTELLWLAKTLKWGRENLANKHHHI